MDDEFEWIDGLSINIIEETLIVWQRKTYKFL